MGELTDQAHDLALFPRLECLECLLLGFLRRQRVALGKPHAFFGQSHNLVLTTALGKLQRRKPSRPKRLDRRIDGLFAVEPFTRQPTHGNASARCTRVDEHPVGAVRKTAGTRELRIDTVKPVEHPVKIDQRNRAIHLSHHSIVRVLTNCSFRLVRVLTIVKGGRARRATYITYRQKRPPARGGAGGCERISIVGC